MVLMNLSAGWQWRHRHRKQTDGHTGGWRGWEKIERVAWKHVYTTIVKQLANGNLLCSTGSLTQCSVTLWMGEMWWEVGGRGHTHIYG